MTDESAQLSVKYFRFNHTIKSRNDFKISLSLYYNDIDEFHKIIIPKTCLSLYYQLNVKIQFRILKFKIFVKFQNILKLVCSSVCPSF